MSYIKYFLKVLAILVACFATIAVFNGILGDIGYIVALVVILVGIGVVCYRRVSGGQKAVTEGVDITVDKDNTIYSIAVKSGTSVFNADSRKRQEQNFQSAQKRAQQAKKAYQPVVGYGYGKKKVKAEKFYLELAGKDFWEWLTGDAEFYTKIVKFMGTRPDEYAKEFDEAYAKAENRMIREFTLKYCKEDGSIGWDTLIKFNSGD